MDSLSSGSSLDTAMELQIKNHIIKTLSKQSRMTDNSDMTETTANAILDQKWAF